MRRLMRLLIILASLMVLGAMTAGAGLLYVLYEYGRALPDYTQLENYEPPVTTRIYAGDGRLLGEYAVEKRVFVPLGAMPKRVVKAFLSAEDKTFYQHGGIDFQGVARAIFINLRNYGTNQKPMGASTITQQVAKNFLLSNEVSMVRKIKEAILAYRIEHTFSKDHILELYLNEIYLGFGSYGVTAAAMNYFNKSLDELSIGEMAYLAALPKAPNNYHPFRAHDAAIERRNWVVGRMLEDGHIGADEAALAQNEQLTVRERDETEVIRGADDFAEEVRRELLQRYGETALYKGGLQVRTTLDPGLQVIAAQTLRAGLITYDRRHGFRGPVARIGAGGGWATRLAEVTKPAGMPDAWDVAVVTGVEPQRAQIGFRTGTTGVIPMAEMTWARAWKEHQLLGPPVRTPAEVVKPGDVILVEPVTADDKGVALPEGTYGLRQMPQIEGALAAIDPHTGRVLAMAGGFSYERSEFNRATQAQRQPGSAFKPFVYLAALDNGYTPSSRVLDAPFVVDQGPGMPKWKPQNYDGSFLGPVTVRVGVEKSRNLMTVRLAQALGMPLVASYAERFGVSDRLTPVLAMSLGAGETTVLRLTGAYAMLVNGGKRIRPTLIDRIQDRNGKTTYRHDDRPCQGCQQTFWTDQSMPALPDTREQITDPISAYQMVSILQGVVQSGTGRRVAEVGKPLAGKTGTSNDGYDTWFVGFSPDLAVGVFVGFDEPRTLGPKETGGSVAAPIFRDFMMEALKDRPATPFRMPPNVRLVRVEHQSGRVAMGGGGNVILEAFKPGTVPEGADSVLGGDGEQPGDFSAAPDGESGLIAAPEPGSLY